MKVTTVVVVVVIITSLSSSDPLISLAEEQDRNLEGFRLSFGFLHLRAGTGPAKGRERIKHPVGDCCESLDKWLDFVHSSGSHIWVVIISLGILGLSPQNWWRLLNLTHEQLCWARNSLSSDDFPCQVKVTALSRLGNTEATHRRSLFCRVTPSNLSPSKQGDGQFLEHSLWPAFEQRHKKRFRRKRSLSNLFKSNRFIKSTSQQELQVIDLPKILAPTSSLACCQELLWM